MRKASAWIRYTIALSALMIGFALTVRLSDNGLLFESNSPEALATSNDEDGAYDLQALSIFNRVLLQMKDNYVEPDRIDPNRMLVSALDNIQSVVPEVVAIFNDEISESPTEVELRVRNESRSFVIGELDTLWEMSFRLREMFRFLQEHIDTEDVDLDRVEYAAVNGMLNTLDPHSILLTPDIYGEMQTNNRGSFGGLGIVISIRDGFLTVVSPIEGTPASRAGFRAGDRIVEIDGESTVNMPLDEAVGKLRGEPGSSVVLKTTRDGWSEPHDFTLEREIIAIESVQHHAMGEGVGYVRITNFQENTHSDLVEALNELREEPGGLQGLILDLRNNPGGLLQQAIRISDLFLSEGTIVTTVGIGDRMREENPASARNTEDEYPIVVLVNPGSASASEIVAGALKNHNRAVVVGDTTFGKGSVQVIYPFQDGSALKLTIAQYLTPGDISIQGVGIVPDLRVFASTITEDRFDLYPNPESIRRESDDSHALTSERIAQEQERPTAVVTYLYEPEEPSDEYRDPDEFREDFEISFARELLTATGSVYERTAMLGRTQGVVERVREEQQEIVREQLRDDDIDWSEGANIVQPITISAQVRPVDEGEADLLAGRTIEVSLSVTNEGARPLHRIYGVSDSDYGIFHDVEFPLGQIAPGETRTVLQRIEIPDEAPSRYERISFKAFADTIELDAEYELGVQIEGREGPQWGISYRLDDAEGGNGDSLLQVGETVTLVAEVTNIGSGNADETITILRDASDDAIFLTNGRDTTEGIPAGETHIARFEFTVQSAPESGQVDLELQVYDTVYREFLDQSFSIPVKDAAPESVTREGFRQLAADVNARVAPAEDALETAMLSENTVVELKREVEGYSLVTWGTSEAWVPTQSLRESRSTNVDGTGVRMLVPYQAPRISLEADALETNADNISVRSIISDNERVRDAYLFVENVAEERSHSMKRSYSFLDVPSATMSEDVPLQPGVNRVTLIARDNNRATSSAVLYIYRHE